MRPHRRLREGRRAGLHAHVVGGPVAPVQDLEIDGRAALFGPIDRGCGVVPERDTRRDQDWLGVIPPSLAGSPDRDAYSRQSEHDSDNILRLEAR